MLYVSPRALTTPPPWLGSPAEPDVRAIAADGLDQSDRFSLFDKTRKNAERAAEAIERLRVAATAARDEGALHAVSLADAATRTLAGNDVTRLSTLRLILQAVSSGVAGGICAMAGLAASCVPYMRGEERDEREECAREMLRQIAQTAKAERAPEISAVEYVGHLVAEGGAPVKALTLLSSPIAQNCRDHAGAACRLGVVTPAVLADIEALASTRNDAVTLSVLQRCKAWRSSGMSAPMEAALRSAAMVAISDGVGATPSNSPAFASSVLSLASSAPANERMALARLALDEATAGAASPAADWLSVRQNLLALYRGKADEADLDCAVLDAVVGGGACDRKALATFAANLRGVTVTQDAPAFGKIVCAQVAALSKAAGDSAAESFARSAIDVLGHPAKSDMSAQRLSTMLQVLAGDLSTMEQCGYAATAVINSGYSSSATEHLAAASSMMGFLLDAARALKDPEVESRIALLQRLHARDCYTDETKDRAIQQGISTLSQGPSPGVSALSTFSSFCYTILGALSYAPDQLAFVTDVIGELQARASATGNDPMLDAADLLARLARVPKHPQARSTWLQSALSYLSSYGLTGPDSLWSLGSYLQGQVSGNYDDYTMVSRVFVDALGARANRRNDAAGRAHARALGQIVDMQFVSMDSHLAALGQAFRDGSRPDVAERATSKVVNDVLTNAGGYLIPREQWQVFQVALDAAKSAGGRERTAFVESVGKFAKVGLADERYRVTVLTTVLNALLADTTPYPGDLAVLALDLDSKMYSQEDRANIGRMALDLAADLASQLQDTEYAPALVAAARDRLAAVGYTETTADYIGLLRQGVQELTTLRGDSYRQALAQLRRAKSPHDQPQISDGDEAVNIGGITVPKKR